MIPCVFLPLLAVNYESYLKLHSHETADQPPTNADHLLWLGRVWSGKKLPALIEERIYPRWTPAASALYPWCTHPQIPLFPTNHRSSGWPIPALHDQPPTYSWYNYAHYAQYRSNPRSDFDSRPQRTSIEIMYSNALLSSEKIESQHYNWK